MPITGATSPAQVDWHKHGGAQGHTRAGRNPNHGLPRKIYVGGTKLNVTNRISESNQCALFTEEFLIDYIILIVTSQKKPQN